jgi:hypothetical protein
MQSVLNRETGVTLVAPELAIHFRTLLSHARAIHRVNRATDKIRVRGQRTDLND